MWRDLTLADRHLSASGRRRTRRASREFVHEVVQGQVVEHGLFLGEQVRGVRAALVLEPSNRYHLDEVRHESLARLCAAQTLVRVYTKFNRLSAGAARHGSG
jgi:hypothetical protein